MRTLNGLLGCCLALAALACGEGSSPEKGPGGAAGTGGGSGATSMAGTSSSAVAGGGSSSGSGGAGGSAGLATGDCPLQGDYSANAELDLPKNDCGTPGSFKTIYNISITGRDLSIEQYVEKVPMRGNINGDCQAEIVVEAPTYREFRLSFAPAALTASGTYVDANSSDCRSTYQASLTLTAK
jgi:hypothetical protein